METISVVYHHVTKSIEIDHGWQGSNLMLAICRKFRLWPGRVYFYTSDGKILDRNQSVSKLISKAADHALLPIIINDKFSPRMEKFHIDNKFDDNAPIPICINLEPQCRTVLKWIRRRDTLASVIGSLMLNGCLSQHIEIQKNVSSTNGMDVDVDNESYCESASNTLRAEDFQLIKDFDVREGDNLHFSFPIMKIHENGEVDVKSVGEIEGQSIAEEETEMINYDKKKAEDSIKVTLYVTDSDDTYNLRIKSSESYASLIGLLIMKRILNYRLCLSRGSQIVFDNQTDQNNKDAKKQDKQDRNKNISTKNFISHCGLRVKDVLRVTFEAMKEKDRLTDGCIKVNLEFPKTDINMKRIYVRTTDTVSNLVRHLVRSNVTDDVIAIHLNGENVSRGCERPVEDRRLLIDDLHLKQDATVKIITISAFEPTVHMICEFPDREEPYDVHISLGNDSKANTIIQHITEKFNVKFTDILVWQDESYYRKGPVWRLIDSLVYYEVDSENNPNKKEWLCSPNFDAMKDRRSDFTDIPRLLDRSQQHWTRSVMLDGDGHVNYPTGAVPIVHAMINIKYRKSTTDGFLAPINPTSELSRGLDSSACLAWLTGILIQDKQKNRNKTLLFVRSRTHFFDPRTGDFVTKKDLKTTDKLPIPKEDRVFYFALIIVTKGTFVPAYVIPSNDNIKLWLREGNMTSITKGLFTNGSSSNSLLNSWIRPQPFSFGVEKYMSDFIRTNFSK